jgi:hypothetical protein
MNLGVRSSNLFGRASIFNALSLSKSVLLSLALSRDIP